MLTEWYNTQRGLVTSELHQVDETAHKLDLKQRSYKNCLCAYAFFRRDDRSKADSGSL